MVRVFISYRREGGEQLARSIVEHFKHKYSHIELFYDIESMRSGKFNKQIYEEIEKRDCVIALLPKNALDRCVNADDWVRLEIAHALKHKKPIIPIMMAGFEWPENIPDDIKEIADFEGMGVNNDLFDGYMEKLARMVYQAVGKRYPVFNYKKVLFGIVAVTVVASGILGIKTYIDHQLTKTDSVVVMEQNIEECQVDMLAVVNGMVMEDGGHYKVASGDEIVVTAGSTVADMAFIGYYFSTFPDDEIVDIEGDNAVIKVPEGIPGTYIDLWVEPVASNDDGSANKVTKTGWKKYTLEYVDTSDISTPKIVLSEPYITILGAVDHKSQELVCEIVSNDVESVTYWWAPWDGITQIADIKENSFSVGRIGFNDKNYLNIEAKLNDGTIFKECYPIPSDKEYTKTEDMTIPLLNVSGSDSNIYTVTTDGGGISFCGYMWNESNTLQIYDCETRDVKSVTLDMGNTIENQWLSVYSQDKSGNFIIHSLRVKNK